MNLMFWNGSAARFLFTRTLPNRYKSSNLFCQSYEVCHRKMSPRPFDMVFTRGVPIQMREKVIRIVRSTVAIAA